MSQLLVLEYKNEHRPQGDKDVGMFQSYSTQIESRMDSAHGFKFTSISLRAISPICVCCPPKLAPIVASQHCLHERRDFTHLSLSLLLMGAEVLRTKVQVAMERQERHMVAVHYLVFTLGMNRSHHHVSLTENL